MEVLSECQDSAVHWAQQAAADANSNSLATIEELAVTNVSKRAAFGGSNDLKSTLNRQIDAAVGVMTSIERQLSKAWNTEKATAMESRGLVLPVEIKDAYNRLVRYG